MLQLGNKIILDKREDGSYSLTSVIEMSDGKNNIIQFPKVEISIKVLEENGVYGTFTVED